MTQRQSGNPRGHSARVIPHDHYSGRRVWRMTCTCGLISGDFEFESECRALAAEHQDRATEREEREITTDG